MIGMTIARRTRGWVRERTARWTPTKWMLIAFVAVEFVLLAWAVSHTLTQRPLR